MNKILALLFLSIMILSIPAIVPNNTVGSAGGEMGPYWFKDYYNVPGHILDLYDFDTVFAPNGDIVVAGNIYGFGAGEIDALVMRVNRCGEIVWYKSYGGVEDDIVSSAIIAPNGDIIVAGWTGSFIEDGDWDLWILRLDGNGSIVWEKDYGGSTDDGGTKVSLAIDPSSGDIVVATSTLQSDNYGGLWNNIWLLRLDKHGNVKWEKTYGVESDEDYAFAVSIAPNGDIVVGGETSGSYWVGDNIVSGAWVLRLDPNGDIIWQKVYETPQAYEEISGILVLPSGDILVSGSSGSLSEVMHSWIAYLDGGGNVKWSKTYIRSIEEGGSISEPVLAPNGDIIGRDIYTIAVSQDGSLKWAKWMIDGAMAGPIISPDGTAAVAGIEAHGFAIGRFNISNVPEYSGWQNPNDPGWDGWGSVDLKVYDAELIVTSSNIAPNTLPGSPRNINVEIHEAEHNAISNITSNTIWSVSSISEPQNLQATTNNNNVELTWDPPIDNGGCRIVEYRIYRGTNNNNLEYYASVNGSTTSFTDKNTANGQTYYYRVSAVNNIVEGPKSNIASATTTSSTPSETTSTTPTTTIGTTTTTTSTSTSHTQTTPPQTSTEKTSNTPSENTSPNNQGFPYETAAIIAVIIIIPLLAYTLIRLK
ncbi:fibronectin type III domain-containing protein [Staphylothermus hellenicus]|uniref:Fibronectin type III domain protein n=1 Tax=Staphylothermus hellenicus (strain DSM 12710 / JCM 10830 / BK20S6-10-b1 / P8) TaxID=591019 RepID=D7DB05_STAHD|nr:fibronectin type III domain-containing protein [Staphylothermus hellenicus]ADI31352.1 Fibronectin type III domain protein [Staphylothermus hellenicus DSM 12710]